MVAKIVVVRDTDYAPVGFLVCKVKQGYCDIGNWDPSDDASVLIQSDWEYPSLAQTFGWQPCHDNTDGTVDCKVCGKTSTQLISEAYDYLMECNANEKIVEDLEGQFFKE
jgi:hypothetical protein